MQWWIFSYLLGNWPLILCVAAIIAALVAIGIFARNWKVFVAAGVILAAGFAYQWIDKHGYERAQAEERQRIIAAKDAEIQALAERVRLVNELNLMHADTALADGKRIEELERAARETPSNDKPALDRAAARRVRDIQWESGGPAAGKDGATPAAACRHKPLLPWCWPRPRPRPDSGGG